jgi:predicted GNAT family N-acyltransferase
MYSTSASPKLAEFDSSLRAASPITIEELPPERFQEAERLWYDVYVGEMNRTQAYTDHERMRIVDPLQASAHIIGAFVEGELIGTVRANYPRQGSVGYYEEFYELNKLGADHPFRTSVVTRIMVRKQYRATAASIRLSSNMFKKLVADNIRWIMCDCNAGVLDFFLRLGFQIHKCGARHPDYGEVTVLKIDADDERYRNPVTSLLARFAY